MTLANGLTVLPGSRLIVPRHLLPRVCLKTMFCTALTLATASLSYSSPPTQVGNSFLDITIFEFNGLGSRDIYFLGNDGTWKLLLNEGLNGPGAQPTFGPSAEGTYTYTPTAGNPSEATLSLNAPGN